MALAERQRRPSPGLRQGVHLQEGDAMTQPAHLLQGDAQSASVDVQCQHLGEHRGQELRAMAVIDSDLQDSGIHAAERLRQLPLVPQKPFSVCVWVFPSFVFFKKHISNII